MIDEQTPSSFQKSEDKPCKSAMCVLVSVEKNALENFPSLLLFPFKNVVLLCYLLKTARTDPNKAVYHRPFVQVCP